MWVNELLESIKIVNKTKLTPDLGRIYNDQSGVYFKDLLSTLLSAFRKRYGYHHVLTKQQTGT